MNISRKVRLSTILASCALLFGSLGAAEPETAPSPIGYWKTLDESTGRPKSIIRIWQKGNELRGRVEKLYPLPGKDPERVCVKCEGSKHNKKVRGLEFLWGFKQEGSHWSDGWILDPENGKTYHANLELVDGGKKLRVFGFIRVIIKIGRSQTWQRASASDVGTPESK